MSSHDYGTAAGGVIAAQARCPCENAGSRRAEAGGNNPIDRLAVLAYRAGRVSGH